MKDPKATAAPSPVIITRIFIDAQGDLVITDLWKEILPVFTPVHEITLEEPYGNHKDL